MRILNVYNRGDKTFTFKFDGFNYNIPPGGPTPIQFDAAWHGFTKSAFGVNIYSNTGVFQLAIEGSHNIAPLSEEEKIKIGQYLDHDFIGKIEGNKFGQKKFSNVLEINSDSVETTPVGFTSEGGPNV
jgi:hypothetical protein